jgi:hypothetical protein
LVIGASVWATKKGVTAVARPWDDGVTMEGGPSAPDPVRSGFDGGGGLDRRDTERDTLVSALEVANGEMTARGSRSEKPSESPDYVDVTCVSKQLNSVSCILHQSSDD